MSLSATIPTNGGSQIFWNLTFWNSAGA